MKLTPDDICLREEAGITPVRYIKLGRLREVVKAIRKRIDNHMWPDLGNEQDGDYAALVIGEWIDDAIGEVME